MDLEGNKLTIETDEGEQLFVLVNPALFGNMRNAHEAINELASNFDDLQPNPSAYSAERIIEELEPHLRERGSDDLEQLHDLMQEWERHITIEWPDGVGLAIEDPDAFDGSPKPKVRLSDELLELLEDG